MSIIKCTECKQPISTAATYCPHCGNRDTIGAATARRTLWKSKAMLLAGTGIAFFGAAAAGLNYDGQHWPWGSFIVLAFGVYLVVKAKMVEMKASR